MGGNPKLRPPQWQPNIINHCHAIFAFAFAYIKKFLKIIAITLFVLYIKQGSPPNIIGPNPVGISDFFRHLFP
jgi:hypothetical protein